MLSRVSIASAVLLLSAPALAWETSGPEFFRRDKANEWRASLDDLPKAPERSVNRSVRNIDRRSRRSGVRAMIVREARRQGVNVNAALRIARVESRFRCNAVGPRTRYGRALGVFQVLPSSARALGYSGSWRALRSCRHGIKVGIAHMRRCQNTWAGNNLRKLARCHVGGFGRPVYSRYANWYVRKVAGR